MGLFARLSQLLFKKNCDIFPASPMPKKSRVPEFVGALLAAPAPTKSGGNG